jgi:hypothetical protein
MLNSGLSQLVCELFSSCLYGLRNNISCNFVGVAVYAEAEGQQKTGLKLIVIAFTPQRTLHFPLLLLL